MNPVEWLLYAAAWQIHSGPREQPTPEMLASPKLTLNEAAALVIAFGGAIRLVTS